MSNDIVLTFQSAENLENMSIVQAAVRARSKFVMSRVGVGVSYKHQAIIIIMIIINISPQILTMCGLITFNE